MSFYDLLNVSEDSPLKDIKDSYRALSKKFHPDKNPNDKYSEEKMKQITEAYEILSDYEKRRQYDLQLHPMDTFMFRPRFNFNFDSMFPTIDHLLQTNSDNISSYNVTKETYAFANETAEADGTSQKRVDDTALDIPAFLRRSNN